MRRNLALVALAGSWLVLRAAVPAGFAIGSAGAVVGDPSDAEQAKALFAELRLAEATTVGEIGAGAGEMTIEMARLIGAAGRIYSNDIDDARLAEIRAAVERAGVSNVTIVKSSDTSPGFPDACCDAIYMRDVYHHFTKPAEMDGSIVRALKPGGRLAVIDFEPNRAGTGLPPGVPANRGGHGIHPATVRDELEAAGLRWLKSEPWLATRSFIVLAEKPAVERGM